MKITDALVAEHTIFLGFFEQIDQVLPSLATPAEVRHLAILIVKLLQAHAQRETDLAYLALDHALAEKGQMERMHQDHKEIDGRFKQVDTARTCAEARRLLQAGMVASRDHFAFEEKYLFPLLEKVLRQETLRELGRAWIDRTTAPALRQTAAALG